jgi:hypothetical protein
MTVIPRLSQTEKIATQAAANILKTSSRQRLGNSDRRTMPERA